MDQKVGNPGSASSIARPSKIIALLLAKISFEQLKFGLEKLHRKSNHAVITRPISPFNTVGEINIVSK